MTTKRFVKYDGNYDSSRTFGMTLADGSDNTIQTTIVPDAGDNTSSIIKRSRFILSQNGTVDVPAGNDVFTFDVPYTLTSGKLYKITANCSIFIHTTGTTVFSGIYEWQQVINDTNAISYSYIKHDKILILIYIYIYISNLECTVHSLAAISSP